MRLLHWLVVILSLPALLHGQVPDSNECGRRSIPLAVLDREYRFVESLRTGNIAVKAGKHRLTVEQITLSSPRRLAILLDISASMVEKRKWSVLQLLAGDVVASTPDDVEIALTTFEDNFQELVAYTRDHDSVRSALQSLTFDGLKARQGKYRTALIDGLRRTAERNIAPSLGDAIYVLTDGMDNRSKNKLRDLRKVLLQRGVRPYFFLIHTVFHEHELSKLQSLASASGGYTMQLTGAQFPTRQQFRLDPTREGVDNLKAAAAALYTPLFRFYSMQLQIPAELQTLDSKLKVAVLDDFGKKRKELEVIHPRELLRCAVTTAATARDVPHQSHNTK